MTKSPRLIGIEFGYGLDPEEGVVLARRIELGDLRCDPATHRFRARIGYDEAQFAQALPSAPRAHHPHSFGRLRHILLQIVTRDTM
jgi:hypothetical protein